ncbi:MAG: hypothetical protein ACMUIM_01100 [bacterium]
MRKNYRLFSWFVWVLFCLLIFPLLSHALTQSPRQNVSFEARWGYYVMDTSKFEESVFGRRYGIIGGAKINLEFPKQFLQIGIGTGYMREHEPFYTLSNIPVEASLNIRLRFSPDQLIVPYIGGGGDYAFFKQNAMFLDPNGLPASSSLKNHRSGYHVNAGFQILLNRFGTESASRFDQKFGVNATYLTFEARYSDLTNFDRIKANETDLSGWFYYMGLLFEF